MDEATLFKVGTDIAYGKSQPKDEKCLQKGAWSGLRDPPL